MLASRGDPIGAALIADRAALQGLLGPEARTEDFERFRAADDTNYSFGPVVDSRTAAYGQARFVLEGVVFRSDPRYNLTWNGRGANRQPSRNLMPVGTVTEVDFTEPARGFGLDTSSIFVPQAVEVEVYGPDDQTLLTRVVGHAATPSTPTFFGYEDPRGIGRFVVIGGNGASESIGIDNVLFANVPEPSTPGIVLLSGAVAARRRQRRHSVAGAAPPWRDPPRRWDGRPSCIP
jgi:hypothetical protein